MAKKEKDPYTLRDIFAEMELELMASLRRNFINHKTEEQARGFSWEMWQKAKLRNLQEYRKETTSVIYRFRKRITQEIEQVLRNHFSVGVRKADIKLPQDGVNTGLSSEEPPQETQFFGVNKKKLDALIKSTKNDFEDVQQAVYRKMDDVYRQTIFKTEFQLSSGAISLGKAIDKATEEFLAKGIDCIVYSNGRHVNIADYAEMALRTASHRATLLGEGSKRDELGVHLVFVSAHANACKLCLPWQGQILIDDVFSHPSDEYIERYKDKYKLLSEAIKAGLLHPNCRHTLATYFEGVTRLPKLQDPKKALENYNNEQRQRKLEREIRKRKRILAGTVEDGDRKEARANLRQAQKNLRDFLEAHPEFKRSQRKEKVHTPTHKVVSELDNFQSSALQGVDKRTILWVDRALTQIYKEYPNLKGIISDVHTMDKGTAAAEISISNDGIKVSLGINKGLTPENAKSLTKRMYEQYKWTKKPGIEGIIKHEMGHVLNYDYYVRKNHLEYGKTYGDEPLQKLINDLERNDFATELRAETLKRLGVTDTDENVARYFSSYAKNKSMTNNGGFFAEAFSDYSDTEAKFIFMELLKERLK
ncbi:phage minor capsid protein [[Clostridium] innocuum]|nr:phage minor capsid protein [[Clostridium] innocuum]